MLAPTTGRIEVLGKQPNDSPAQLARVGYVAQDTPTCTAMSVADHLTLGAKMNPGWDVKVARTRIEQLGLDPKQKAGKLSGGQRAQLALTIAVAKRPELLLLDEPVASLDPLARRGFLRHLMESVAENETSVILSSHLVSDLERVCDYLVVISAPPIEDSSGHVVSANDHHDCFPGLDAPPGGGLGVAKGIGPNIERIGACLAPYDLHETVTYQPASHYWPLQWIETGIFLVLGGR
jgi:ABC-type sulfate/molybdate transport systems ATPase subunit